MTAPVFFSWDGEAMIPRHPRLADKAFVVGETYPLVVHEERSSATHAHYFACIKSAWDSMPDFMASQFPTTEHLRKFALIRCGYRDEQTMVCASKAEALRVAAFIRPIDDFSIVTTAAAVVVRWTAKSQSMRAMGKKDFQESKEKVLDYIAGIIGVQPQDIRSAA